MSGDDDDRIFEQARANLETLVYKEFVNKIVFECYNAYLKAKKQGITDITEEVIYANLEPEASAEDKENVDPEPKVYVECDICSEKVIVSRYTNHRSKCSGNGRRCNIEAQKRITEQFNSEEDIRSTPPKKNKRKKKKKK